MTDQQTTEESTEVVVPKDLYYEYTELGDGVGYSNGNVIEVDEGGPQPPNTSRFKPPAPTSTTQAYWDSYGWFVGVPYSAKLTQKLEAGAKLQVTQSFDAKFKALLAQYDELESDTFLRQEQDAKAYKSGQPASAFLQNLAQVTDQDLDVLVDSILSNAESYSAALGRLLGQYKLAIAAVKAANVKVTKDNIQLIFGL